MLCLGYVAVILDKICQLTVKYRQNEQGAAFQLRTGDILC
jgi:hypothetical protein